MFICKGFSRNHPAAVSVFADSMTFLGAGGSHFPELAKGLGSYGFVSESLTLSVQKEGVRTFTHLIILNIKASVDMCKVTFSLFTSSSHLTGFQKIDQGSVLQQS